MGAHGVCIGAVDGGRVDVRLHLTEEVAGRRDELRERHRLADAEVLDLPVVIRHRLGAVDPRSVHFHRLLRLHTVHVEELVNHADDPLADDVVQAEALLHHENEAALHDVGIGRLPLGDAAHEPPLEHLQPLQHLEQLLGLEVLHPPRQHRLLGHDVELPRAVDLHALVEVVGVHADPAAEVPRLGRGHILVVGQAEHAESGLVAAPDQLLHEREFCVSQQPVHCNDALEGDQPPVPIVHPFGEFLHDDAHVSAWFPGLACMGEGSDMLFFWRNFVVICGLSYSKLQVLGVSSGNSRDFCSFVSITNCIYTLSNIFDSWETTRKRNS
mmetsp:Transcript_12614/g.29951  ORF Transcript_12614/g.29951 Transcript_12614/m.29951 type:complete len:327 (-) Transcript_12614:58-1038(-)